MKNEKLPHYSCPMGSRRFFEKTNLRGEFLTCGNVDKTCNL
jgi:hypothetical protein